MTTTLSISDFKDICETIGRFADIRETAKEPRDRVVVQVGGGRLKFIAGTEDMTVIADAAPAEGKDKAVVKSRLLLNAAKALRGRGEVGVEVDRAAVFLTASTGGKVKLASIASMVPAFVRPPKKQEAQTILQHPGFGLASKVFPAVTSKHHPSDKVYVASDKKHLTFTATDQRSYGEWSVPVDMSYVGPLGALPRDLFPAMRDLVAPGAFAMGDGRIAIRSGRFLVGVALLPDGMPWGSQPETSDNCRVYVGRKPLIDALRGMAGSDVNKRVRLQATGTTGLLVENWEGAGSMTLESETSGPGRVGVDAGRMNKLLTALPGKLVVIEFEGTRPGTIRLTAEEATGWQTLLAPVV